MNLAAFASLRAPISSRRAPISSLRAPNASLSAFNSSYRASTSSLQAPNPGPASSNSSFRTCLESLRAGIGVVALLVSSAAAADYSWQVAGSHRNDSAGNLETNRNRLNATYYFFPVEDGDGPYELAPFLNQSSFAAFDAARERSRQTFEFPALGTIGPGPVDDRFGSLVPAPVGIWPLAGDELDRNLDADASDYAVSGQYVWPEGGWYAGGRFERGTGAEDRPTIRCYYDPVISISGWCEQESEESVTDSEGFDLWAGKYFGHETALDLRIGSNVRTTMNEIGLALPFLPLSAFGAAFEFGSETETESAMLSVRRAGLLGSSVYWLAANVSSIRSDTRLIYPSIGGFDPFPDLDLSTSSYRYGFTAGLYPTRTLGFRMSFLRGDGGGGLTGVSASWFFVPRAAVEARLTRVEFDFEPSAAIPTMAYPVLDFPGPDGLDSISLRLLGRF